ncbi:hypothetical protein HY484_00080 [Candidatus Woesearchaeota archaeon]|nr:hypothetical protein [Candidatus Woesearchaeota archaeon]
MKTEHLLFSLLGLSLILVSFQAYSLFTVQTQTPHQQNTVQPTNINLPANIQSSAPIQFKSFEEEVAYYKKNAKNPNNLDIEKAVRNMDKNLDGVCDKCGMAILHCIESGMENM